MSDFIISKQLGSNFQKDLQDITLIYQIQFSETNEKYNKEIKQTLKFNVNNPFINKIILLNEKAFTEEELGVTNKKIKQIRFNKKLTFKDVFNQIYGDKMRGYIIIGNQNVFFDESIQKIFTSGLASKKQMLTLNRYEYTDKNLKRCKLFGPRADMQEVFIYHSKNIIDKKIRKIFNFNTSAIQANSKFLYLLSILGFELINDPIAVKCYHNGEEKLKILKETLDKIEEYEENKNTITMDTSNLEPPPPIDQVDGPFMYVVPKLNRFYDSQYYPITSSMRYLKTTFEKYTNNKVFNNDVERFHIYLKNALELNEKFSIFKNDPIWVNISNYIIEYGKAMQNEDEYALKIAHSSLSGNVSEANKKNINIETMEDAKILASNYLRMLELSDVSLHYSPLSNILQSSPDSHKEIMNIANKGSNKLQLDQNVVSPFVKADNKTIMEIINNKNILVITKYQNELTEQIKKMNDIWGFSAFENCNIKTLNAPTHSKDDVVGDKKLTPPDVIQAYLTFIENNSESLIKDVGLVLLTEGHFNSILLHYFKSKGISVIDCGNNLELYFGIYNETIFEENKFLINLYKNGNWVKVE